MLSEWLVLFEPLELICFVQLVVVHLSKEARILVEALMPPVERIVDVALRKTSINELVDSPMEVWDHCILVLVHTLVHAMVVVGRAKSSINSVLVRAPHVCQSLLDVLIVGLLREVCWQEEDQGYVLYSELEQCWKKIR